MSQKPFGLLSDTHYHDFNTFSFQLESGLNSRLRDTIDATLEAAKAMKAAGVTRMIHGGDCFHVRGKLSPSVLNPVIELYRDIVDMGIEVVMLAGNHDLETREATEIGNATHALAQLGVKVITEMTIDEDNKQIFFPWVPSVNELKKQLLALKRRKATKQIEEFEIFIHAPLNGVIVGIPDAGLDPDWIINKLGCKRLFCGHYHNHVSFSDRAYSIGSLTHQNFGDVNALAGYLIVGDDVVHHQTSAPKFIDLDPDNHTNEELFAQAKGNYCRLNGGEMTAIEVEDVRNEFLSKGALGISIISQPKQQHTQRDGAVTMTSSSGVKIETSVQDWVDGAKHVPNKKEVTAEALDILKTVQEFQS